MALNFANNNSLSAITAKPSGLSGGALNLISTQTASSSSTISFTSGIDSTYDEYVFKFYDIHPATNNQDIQFNGSVDGGSNYNVTKTSTTFQAQHDEADSEALLQYNTDRDLAQSTSAQRFSLQIGNDNDQSVVGTLHLFDPSNTTFVKNFLFRGISPYPSSDSDGMKDQLVAGYANTTSAVNAIQFKMLSGNIDSGTNKLYGVS